jgi:4-hydroxybenzoate polyprenyltransferase
MAKIPSIPTSLGKKADQIMLTKSTLLHLRFPFSYFLLPIYLFALSSAENPILWKALLIFFILHLFLYPASNSFNSYYDCDTGSIGVLKNPPPVEKELIIFSLILDAIAVLLSLIIGWLFALAIIIYSFSSKLYSHHKIRIKRQPIISLLGIGFVQGAFTFFTVYSGIQDGPVIELLNVKLLFAAVLSSAFLIASYPMTQIYQHDEDRKHGDTTFSILLGIQGTFLFCGVFLIISLGGFAFYFLHYYGLLYAVTFILFLIPVAIYFISWFFATQRNKSEANWSNTMRLNLYSSTALNFCLILFIAVMHIKF